MEYPHKRYLLYLLSRQMNGMEVRADCTAKGLLPPTDIDLTRMAHYDLGAAPSCWRATVTKGNVSFRRWLRNKGVLPLWNKDVFTEKAVLLLHRPEVRKDLETVLLVHGDVEQARKELLVKYTESMVPDEKVLYIYQEFFWNTGEMSPEGIYAYMEACQSRDVYLPALQGDLVATYGVLGLQQRIKGEVFLQNIVEAANQQILRLRASPNASGATLAGMSSVWKTGIEALTRLEERHNVIEGDVGIRKDAADFIARVVQGSAVPSIDEVGRDVIEAEEYQAVGAGNVVAITGRRSD